MANPYPHGWAIWSRRPQDPARAPGIIISSNAKPPPHIVQFALDLPTPPPSPPPTDIRDHLSPSTTDVDTPTYTDSTTHPGSPVSSSTSLSISINGTSAKEEEDTKRVVPDTPIPSTLNIATPTPAPTPPRKSWASLLQTPASSSSSTTPRRNALPTSSVVGISIPAAPPSPSTTPTTATLPFTPTQRAELLALLNSNLKSKITIPDSPLNKQKTKEATGRDNIDQDRIRPRGLINSGNMCFANSVLQVLVYCPPFRHLFTELGRLGVARSRDAKEKDREKEKEKGNAPLVEATIEFVREFSVPSPSAPVTDGVNGKNGTANGRSKGGKDKGKDRAIDGWDMDSESFLPSGVYDAMKENKRFDNMRCGQQEDAEEFLGFFLDTLEEELLTLVNALSGRTEPGARVDNQPGGKGKPPSVSADVGSEGTLEREEEEEEEDGWLEVGKRNRMVVTRTIKSAESPITRIFGGKFRSTLKVPQQKDSVIVEDWRALRLDIQHDTIHTIQDALAHIATPQSIQLATRSGSQQVLIDALPQVLVVHLKRFCFTYYDVGKGSTEGVGIGQDGAGAGAGVIQGEGKGMSGGVVKVAKQVRFGPMLEFGPDVMAPVMRRTQPTRYKLFGVIYHHGHSASGGHYTLDVLHHNRFPNAVAPRSTTPASSGTDGSTGIDSPGEGWIRIDDELVSDVRPDDVFGGSAERGMEDGRCAYLLFYQRVR